MAFVCVVLIGIEAVGAWHERDTQLARSRENTLNLAHSLAQHAEDTFEIADMVLIGLVDRLEAGSLVPGRTAELSGFLYKQVAAQPRLRGLFIYDAAGQWVASSLGQTPTNLNNSDRAYFQHHAASSDRASFVGFPIQSRSGGQWILTLSRRVNHHDGRFAGVVLATIDVGFFSNHYRTFSLGGKGSIALAHANGTMLARYPSDNAYIGRDLSRDRLFTELLPKASSGHYDYVSPFDQVERLSGYVRANRYPLVVLAALCEDEALSSWWMNTLLRMAAVGLIAGLISFLGILLVRQIRRRQAMEGDLRALARTDGLTGLANRRTFDEKLAREWRRACRDGSPLSVILLDVDRFKLYNDVYGHQAGDVCLRAVATAVAGLARRSGDLVARYGGEEIVLLFPDTPRMGAELIAETIVASVEGLALPHVENQPCGVVTVSVGVATILPGSGPQAFDDPSLLVAAADSALYKAKRSGRNQFVLAPDLVSIARALPQSA